MVESKSSLNRRLLQVTETFRDTVKPAIKRTCVKWLTLLSGQSQFEKAGK